MSMKKIFTIIAAALMSASMFAQPATFPTVTDLADAGYDLTSRVICLYFDEQVYYDIVWAGSYNGWSIDNPANMIHFKPLEGFAGWYVAEVNDARTPQADQKISTGDNCCVGKPVQLKKDGSFSWDFQSGDAEAWINMAQPGTKQHYIYGGIPGEADICWNEYCAYIYEVAYFKNHNNPSVEYKYTEYVNWQLKHEGSEWQWTENLVKVEEGLFILTDAYWTGSGFNVGSDANPIKKDWFAPEELVLGEEVIAPVTVDVYLKVVDDETVMIGVGVEPPAPASGPTVDKTGITVNGRKYGFPVRLVKEVK